jgi:hypothetical protein
MLSFLDFSKEFHVYTDASNYQLGGVIMQDDKSLAFYSRKLQSAQINYTTGEKELLSIVEILREFRNILLGHKITVHTEHKNILYRSLPTQRIMRWRMLLEEYDITFVHIKGTDNVVADGISCLDADWQNGDDLTQMIHAMSEIQFDESIEINYQVTPYNMAASYMKSKDLSDEDFPMNPSLIAKYQSLDKKLKKEMTDAKGKDFSVKVVEGVSLVHQNDKIQIPSKLQSRIIAWYHEYLAHPGENRTKDTISQVFTWPQMWSQVKTFCKTCPQCQLWKRKHPQYGKLPIKEAKADPWTEVHVDMMGPLSVTTPSKKLSLLVFTAINPATGWFECIEVPNKEYRIVHSHGGI